MGHQFHLKLNLPATAELQVVHSSLGFAQEPHPREDPAGRQWLKSHQRLAKMSCLQQHEPIQRCLKKYPFEFPLIFHPKSQISTTSSASTWTFYPELTHCKFPVQSVELRNSLSLSAANRWWPGLEFQVLPCCDGPLRCRSFQLLQVTNMESVGKSKGWMGKTHIFLETLKTQASSLGSLESTGKCLLIWLTWCCLQSKLVSLIFTESLPTT